VVEKKIQPKNTIKVRFNFQNDRWDANDFHSPRCVQNYGLLRTLSFCENPYNMHMKGKLTIFSTPQKTEVIETRIIENIEHIKYEAERILGKSLADFKLIEINLNRTKIKRGKSIEISRELSSDNIETVMRKKLEPDIERTKTSTQLMFVGSNGDTTYSEFNFGSGEASIIRLVTNIEELPNSSLVLIDEIENGLHPLAVKRLVEYLIVVAKRKDIQTIFTTHSDYALAPLPSEAIWSCIDGTIRQGKLTIDVLRAVSGRIDKRLAIFVEDEFAKAWIESILREKIPDHLEEIGVYPVGGDGNAVKIQEGHTLNPSIHFHSLCFIDGDSQQHDDEEKRIYRLPGLQSPELYIFNSVLEHLSENIAIFTAACQRPLDKQDQIAKSIEEISRTNRDPHLIYSQVGLKLGFVPEATIRGAFLIVWVQDHPTEIQSLIDPILETLDLPTK
ncbi:MAG TPA: AAA family ATPase, partial [Candidatus Lokiarchaeia archaeon]|nr:AAA family ATPase [Candidatus Lokiarchaeia archaeon]